MSGTKSRLERRVVQAAARNVAGEHAANDNQGGRANRVIRAGLGERTHGAAHDLLVRPRRLIDNRRGLVRIAPGGKQLLLGNLIEMQFKGTAYNPQLGSAVALVMMLVVVVCMTVMNRFGEGEEQAVML